MFQNYFNPQPSIDRINAQINELEKQRAQLQQPIQQPTNLTQNFQLAPTNREAIRYANSIEEVQRDLVISDTAYFSKDFTVVWIKNAKGEIKSYELKQIIQKDEKDIKIEYLQAQIEQLKGMISNESKSNIDQPTTNAIESKEPTTVSKVSKFDKKSK